MASTAPPKSQPLHNFALPQHLQWKKDGQSGSGGNGHQRRRSIKSPSRRPNATSASASPAIHSPLRDSVHATPPRHHSPPPAPFQVREWTKQRSTISSDPPPPHFRRHHLAPEPVDYPRIQKMDGSRSISASSTNPERNPAKSKGKEIEAPAVKKSKFLIKIPCKINAKTDDETPVSVPAPIPAPPVENKSEADENVDEETKVWNLRPRKPVRRPMCAIDAGFQPRNTGSEKNKSGSKSAGDNNPKKNAGEKKEKKKLSVFLSLSKEEIEEDIYSLTGSKPARRPKKRSKIVQRHVETLFPGSWLVSISADSYKVSESSLKG